MKKIKNLLLVILSVVLLINIYPTIPTYAQTKSSNSETEYIVENAKSVMKNRSQRISAAPITSVSTYSELVAALNTKANNIYLLEDIYLEEALEIDYDVSFLAATEGKTIYAAADNCHIQVTTSDIQLQFDNVILDGNYKNGTTVQGGIDADNTANITIIGLIIQHCYSKTISNTFDSDESSFWLYNCTIKDNINGAVDTYASNILLYNVLVENNKETLYLGAYDDTRTSETAIYNSTIHNNTTGSSGGGIQLYNTNAYLDANTLIENNTASYQGGGIYAFNSNIESYASIKNNTAADCGGGISLEDSTFIMQGGEISNNSANLTVLTSLNYGGGIAINSTTSNPAGDVIINDGIIEKNVAAYGGAIGGGQNYSYEFAPSYVKINGGVIRNNGNQTSEIQNYNYICENGGGISANKVEITDGIIEKNHSLIGAGVCTAHFIMSGGFIQDNGYFISDDGEIIVQTGSGGGVFSRKSAVITGGLIYSNMARNGGGIFLNGSLDLSAPAYIRYNTATDCGGGVYLGSNTGEIDYSRIINNTAPYGSQYYPIR